MSKPLPEKELPVNLRVSQALAVRRDQVEAQPESGVEADLLTVPALAAGAASVLLGTGWLLRRRHRLARRPRRHVEIAPSQPIPAAPAPAPAPSPAPTDEAAAAREAEIMADLASQFEDEPDSLQPQQTFPAPLEHPYRRPSRVALACQKTLIKCLMWVRTVAGCAALAAAIAVVVFGAIELGDLRSGDTGLTRPLLLLLVMTWAASWGAGRLANQLHRAFFGRAHPRFDN